MMEFDPYNDDTGLPDPLPPEPLPIPPPESAGFEDPIEGEDKAYYAPDAEAEGLLEPELISPVPESQDDTLGATDDYGNLIGQDDSTDSDNLTGRFDAWSGEVLKVHYGSTDPIYGLAQVIEVMKCSVHYGTNNDPIPGLGDIGVHGDSTPAAVLARPFPARHDQQEYHVEEGDIVTVVMARDGNHYFFSDDLPFIGTVEDIGTNSEDGDGFESVKVRRQAIEGTPAALELSDLEDKENAFIEYDNVWVIKGGGHGSYVQNDEIVVHRRGSFLFASPSATKSFVVRTVNGTSVGEATSFLDVGGLQYWYVDEDWLGTPTDSITRDENGDYIPHVIRPAWNFAGWPWLGQYNGLPITVWNRGNTVGGVAFLDTENLMPPPMAAEIITLSGSLPDYYTCKLFADGTLKSGFHEDNAFEVYPLGVNNFRTGANYRWFPYPVVGDKIMIRPTLGVPSGGSPTNAGQRWMDMTPRIALKPETWITGPTIWSEEVVVDTALDAAGRPWTEETDTDT